MSAEAENLEAITKAIIQHNGNCEFPLIEIAMCPFEVDRLDWPEIRGIPVVADEKMPTGRFELRCAGEHGDRPTAIEAEKIAA